MTSFLNPKILSRIKPLELRAKHIVEGFLVGIHRSPYHGFSVEFAEHRPYQPGDDPKRIDWKVYARRERLYTKKSEQETNALIHIILDASNSMSYSSGGITKFEYGATVGASLAWLLIHQKDMVSLTVFDEKIRSYVPPASTRLHLSRIAEVMESTVPAKQTSIQGALDEIAMRIKKRGIVILISDLLADESSVIRAVKNMRHRNNEVIVFHILDPAENEFPFREPMIFRDMETQSEIPVSPDIKTSYQQRMSEFLATYRKGFFSNDIDYLLLSTNEPVEESLVFYLSKRKKRRRR
jgi:uncharacterized protein (DUF58 family)